MPPTDSTEHESFRRAAWRFISYPALFPATLLIVYWVWRTLPHDPISGISAIKSATSAPLTAPPATFTGKPATPARASPFPGFRPLPAASIPGVPQTGTLVSEDIRFIILDGGGYTIRRREDQYTMADYAGRYGAMHVELRRTRRGIWALTSEQTEVHIPTPLFVIEPIPTSNLPFRSARPISQFPDENVPAVAAAAKAYYLSAGAGNYTNLMVKHLNRFSLGQGPESRTLIEGYFIDIGTVAAMILCLCSAYRFITLPWRFIRDRLRARTGKCLKCGYDLAGLTSSICPECGGSIRLPSPSPSLPPPS